MEREQAKTVGALKENMSKLRMAKLETSSCRQSREITLSGLNYQMERVRVPRVPDSPPWHSPLSRSRSECGRYQVQSSLAPRARTL